MDWIVYAFHESSIMVCGQWLTQLSCKLYPACAERTYKGPYPSRTWSRIRLPQLPPQPRNAHCQQRQRCKDNPGIAAARRARLWTCILKPLPRHGRRRETSHSRSQTVRRRLDDAARGAWRAQVRFPLVRNSYLTVYHVPRRSGVEYQP